MTKEQPTRTSLFPIERIAGVDMADESTDAAVAVTFPQRWAEPSFQPFAPIPNLSKDSAAIRPEEP
jgi:hypothetical protein